MRQENQALREENAALKVKVAGLERQNEQLLRKVLGRTSEKMPPIDREIRRRKKGDKKRSGKERRAQRKPPVPNSTRKKSSTQYRPKSVSAQTILASNYNQCRRSGPLCTSMSPPRSFARFTWKNSYRVRTRAARSSPRRGRRRS